MSEAATPRFAFAPMKKFLDVLKYNSLPINVRCMSQMASQIKSRDGKFSPDYPGSKDNPPISMHHYGLSTDTHQDAKSCSSLSQRTDVSSPSLGVVPDFSSKLQWEDMFLQQQQPPQQFQLNKQNTVERFKPFHEEKWGQRLDEIRLFRKQHGHCLVPHTYPLNPQLARWVKRQRRQKKLAEDGLLSTLTVERMILLEDIGFIWDRHDEAWKGNIQALRDYRTRHGDCLVPCSYQANPRLAVWVKCQRRQHKLYTEGKPCAISKVRIAELNMEGFHWEVRGSGARQM